MNGIDQFISSLTHSLAWPIAAVVMVFAFRKPLTKIMGDRTVKALKAGPQGFSVEFFDETIDEVRTELEDSEKPESEESTEKPSAPPPPGENTGEKDFMAEMQQLAEISPAAVVTQSFARLERTLRVAVNSAESPGRDGDAVKFISARQLARKARDQGIISSAELFAIDEIAGLRNVIAHEGNVDIDKERALSYADLVRQLLFSISLGTKRNFWDGPSA